MRAFHGFFIVLTYNVYYTYFIETLTAVQRSRIGSLPDVITGVSPCLNALIAYYARDWRAQIYIIGGLNGASLLLLWFIPKSKEWLATQTASPQKTDKWERVKLTLKGSTLQFKMIIKSSPVLRVALIIVSFSF